MKPRHLLIVAGIRITFQRPMDRFDRRDFANLLLFFVVVCLSSGQIYSADQSASSFSSHPTTPVSSPPPLTSVNQSQWAAPAPPGPAHPVGVANTASPHYAERNLHLVTHSTLLFGVQSLEP